MLVLMRMTLRFFAVMLVTMVIIVAVRAFMLEGFMVVPLGQVQP